jgi:hypothetical protein
LKSTYQLECRARCQNERQHFAWSVASTWRSLSRPGSTGPRSVPCCLPPKPSQNRNTS